MRWKKSLISLLVVLLFSGCGRQPSSRQDALDLRTALLEAQQCSFLAVIGVDAEQRLYSFSVSCTYRTDGAAEIMVLQPEEIAGISAVLSGEQAVLEFEDLELDFGDMANDVVSPMEACKHLGDCWAGGYIQSSGQDGELQRITYLDGYGEEELTVDTWLDAAHQPVYAEITYDGTRCMTLQLSEFQLEDVE